MEIRDHRWLSLFVLKISSYHWLKKLDRISYCNLVGIALTAFLQCHTLWRYDFPSFLHDIPCICSISRQWYSGSLLKTNWFFLLLPIADVQHDDYSYYGDIVLVIELGCQWRIWGSIDDLFANPFNANSFFQCDSGKTTSMSYPEACVWNQDK